MLTQEELKKVDPKELLKELAKARQELMKTRLKLVDQSSKDSHHLKIVKKYIAQILTVLNSKKSN